MCKYRWVCNYANRRSLWKWNMCWYTWFFQMWMPFRIWDQASHDSSIQFSFLLQKRENFCNKFNSYKIDNFVKQFFRFVWISMNALRTHFYVAAGVVSILQVNNKHLRSKYVHEQKKTNDEYIQHQYLTF